mmetsp:Transcript_11411/g.26370  ORF Transcript_11411/g.26370 Transcript_11411/m.26370 type:complete len:1312 (+) Transcript_11411:74-4009(+)
MGSLANMRKTLKNLYDSKSKGPNGKPGYGVGGKVTVDTSSAEFYTYNATGAGGRARPHGGAVGSGVRRVSSLPPPGSVCCLAWCLSAHSQAVISDSELEDLHREIKSCAQMAGAKTIEDDGAHGVLICDQDIGEMITSADTAIRLGQQLCRWAVAQDPPVGLRVGAHMGLMRKVKFGDSQESYIGSAMSTACYLAESSPTDAAVRFLKVTKNCLKRFQGLPFSISEKGDSYLLDAGLDDDGLEDLDMTKSHVHPSPQAQKKDHAQYQDVTTIGKAAGERMTQDDFRDLLDRYDVDVSAFGQGSAKSIEDMYQETVINKKSILTEVDGKLERRMELVRINLVAKDAVGQDRMLRMATEIMEDGRMRTRNQKLAHPVLTPKSWKQAMRECFEQKLKLNEQMQGDCLNMDMEWVKTESTSSPSYPGIDTKYFTHEVRVRVNDTSQSALSAIGLPGMKNFTTSDGNLRWTWTWTPVGEQSTYEDILSSLLQEHGVDISQFKSGAFEELLDEVYTTKSSMLMVRDGELQRYLQIVKVWLTAEILSIPYLLVIRSKIQNGIRDFNSEDRPISMRMTTTQTWEEAVAIALQQRVGLDYKFQQENTIIDFGSYRLREEMEISSSFPGLKTIYSIHEMQVRLRSDLVYPSLGLPDGHEFAFSRAEGRKGTNMVTTYFCWKSRKELLDEKVEKAMRRGSMASSSSDGEDEVPDAKRRLEVPSHLRLPVREHKSGTVVIKDLMSGKSTDWTRAKNAAKRITDPSYTLKMFTEDCLAAFPEISLYVYEGGDAGGTTSGRSADDEYQRTMGALYAVFWLMRLDADGVNSFTFGVGDDWRPLGAKSKTPKRTQKERKQREAFRKQVQWSRFEGVLKNAGLLQPYGVGHNEERVLAMLVLTAIHDVMKVAALLPVVEEKTGDWGGYKVGETINDHDLALGYILEFHEDALPSYAGLPPKQRESVKFTQCKMEYNMGWLVQAEAPPGALFRKFKTIIRSGHASQEDVAFYFTHWLTDLAGAEPFPLEGCEKFVLKFPQKVLMSFLNSFPVVQLLSDKAETEVLEDYLVSRWESHEPPLGFLPLGRGSIAKLRLVCMAQSNADNVLRAFDEMTKEDEEVLSDELARTGCVGQEFQREKAEAEVPLKKGGPAILVYYSPALMQKNAATDAAGALTVLAEVFRKSREMWPLTVEDSDENVIIRIDALKELEVPAMSKLDPGEVWMLQKTSQKDGQVKRLPVLADDGTHNTIDWTSNRVLTFRIGDTAPIGTPCNLFYEGPIEDDGPHGTNGAHHGTNGDHSQSLIEVQNADSNAHLAPPPVCNWCINLKV